MRQTHIKHRKLNEYKSSLKIAVIIGIKQNYVHVHAHYQNAKRRKAKHTKI